MPSPTPPPQVLSQGSFLSGGSPFVPLDSANARYLALVHHYAKHRRRVYFHHFVTISAVAAAQQAQQAGAAAAQQEGDAHGEEGLTAGGGPRGGWRFRVDWVSEPFRCVVCVVVVVEGWQCGASEGGVGLAPGHRHRNPPAHHLPILCGSTGAQHLRLCGQCMHAPAPTPQRPPTELRPSRARSCRLPNSQPQGFGVQFATGLLRAGSDSALYIAYGISDCFAALARVEGIEQRLRGWRERGMGTQHPVALQ